MVAYISNSKILIDPKSHDIWKWHFIDKPLMQCNKITLIGDAFKTLLDV